MKNYMLLLLLIVGLTTHLGWATDSAPEVKGLKIVVVDVTRLMAECDKSKKLEGTLKEKAQKEQLKIKNLRDEIMKKEEERKLAGDAGEDKLIDELRTMHMEYKIMEESFPNYFQEMKNKYTMQVYGDIEDAVATLAKAKQYDVVLKKTNLDNVGDREKQMEILSNDIIYYQPGLDVTDDVMKILNLKFRQDAPAQQPVPTK